VPHAIPLRFDRIRTATAIEPESLADLASALAALGLTPSRSVLVLVGGADGLDPVAERALEGLFRNTLVPLIETLGAAVIDGGTDAGIMALMGQARAGAGAGFPLLGIAPRAKVCLPGMDWRRTQTKLEPNHDRFLLVPGADWGAESPWIAAAAPLVAGTLGRTTLVAGGGQVTRLDVEAALAAGTPVLLLAGSGGTADTLARALADGSAYPSPGRGSLLRRAALQDAGRTLPNLLRGLLAG
jgi:hypothetical protein